MQIQIIKVPAGPAPDWVRRAWVGLYLQAPDDQGPEPEVDFMTPAGRDPVRRGGEIAGREHIKVPTREALDALEKSDPRAAEWFRWNLPPGMSALGFGRDEVRLLTSSDN